MTIDATDMSTDPEIVASTIWFNFPWITIAEIERNRDEGRPHSSRHAITSNAILLTEFVKSAAHLQREGGLLLITLTCDPMWEKYYGLSRLVVVAEAEGYKHYEEPNTDPGSVITDCVNFGYHHRSVRNKGIHRFVVTEYGSTFHIFVKGEYSIAALSSKAKLRANPQAKIRESMVSSALAMDMHQILKVNEFGRRIWGIML